MRKLWSKIKALFSKKVTKEEKEVVERFIPTPEAKRQAEEPKDVEFQVVDEKKERVAKTPLCLHCRKDFEGSRESAADEDGTTYVCCKHCGFVMRKRHGMFERTGQDITEVKKAQRLFQEVGVGYSSYKATESSSHTRI